MATKPPVIGETILYDVRLAFAKLFEPDKSAEGGGLKFSANFLMDPNEDKGQENIEKCEAAVADVIKNYAPWKNKEPRIKPDRKFFLPGDDCRNATTGEIYGGFEGMMVAKASKKAAPSPDPKDPSHKRFRPQLFYRGNKPITEDDGTLYAGCRVDAVIRFYAVHEVDKGGAGIFASAELIRFRRDDTPFGAPPVDVSALEDSPEEDGDDPLV